MEKYLQNIEMGIAQHRVLTALYVNIIVGWLGLTKPAEILIGLPLTLLSVVTTIMTLFIVSL